MDREIFQYFENVVWYFCMRYTIQHFLGGMKKVCGGVSLTQKQVIFV